MTSAGRLKEADSGKAFSICLYHVDMCMTSWNKFLVLFVRIALCLSIEKCKWTDIL